MGVARPLPPAVLTSLSFAPTGLIEFRVVLDDREIDVEALDYRAALKVSRDARDRGDRILAVRAAYQAYSILPSAEACVALGKAFVARGSIRAAEVCFKESIRIDDSLVDNRFGYIALAGFLRSSREIGNLQRARHIARQVLSANPGDVVAGDFLAAVESDLRWIALPYDSRRPRQAA